MKIRMPIDRWSDNADNVMHEAEIVETEKMLEQEEMAGGVETTELDSVIEEQIDKEVAVKELRCPIVRITPEETTEAEKAVAMELISAVTRLTSEETAEAETLEPKNTEETPEMPEANIKKTLTEEAIDKQLISPVRRPEIEGTAVKPSDKLNITRCTTKKKNAEPLFFPGEVTYSVFKGKTYPLFKGVLRILERRVSINEKHDLYGRVMSYNASARFFVALELKDKIYTAELSAKELMRGDFLAEISLGESSLESGSKEKMLFEKLTKKLMSDTDDYKTVTIFCTPGWKSYGENHGKKWYYVTPEGAIGRPELKYRSIEGKVFGVNTMYTGKSVIADFLSMRHILPRNLVAAILLQYYFIISLLKGLLRYAGLAPQFIVAIIGETNSKKTTIGHLFCKLYDRWNNVDIDFTATPVALEEAMGDNADAITIFDDLTPPSARNEAREQGKKLEMIVRSYGGNLAKKRSRAYVIANPGASEYTPVLNQAVVTGETLPVTRTSSRSRIVKADLVRGDCDLQWLTWHQHHLEILPAFAWDFITFVTDNQHSILQNWRIVFDTERRMNSLKLETPRFVESYAMFKAAVETFKAYLKVRRGMPDAEIEALAMADINVIGQLIKENDEELIDRPDEVLIAECIMNEMEAQDKSERNIRPEEEILDQEELVLVYPSYLRKILTDFYRCNGRPIPFSTTTELSKFLDRKGLILTSLDSTQVRYALKKRDAQGAYRRYYCLHKNKLESLKLK